MKKQNRRNRPSKSDIILNQGQQQIEASVSPSPDAAEQGQRQTRSKGNTKNNLKNKDKSKPKNSIKTKSINKTKSRSSVISQKIEQKQKQVQNNQISYQVSNIAESKYKVKVHKNYQIEKQSEIGKNIQNLVALLIKKQSIKNTITKKSSNLVSKVYKVCQFTYYPTFEFVLSGQKPQHQKCSICQFEYESLSNQDMQKQLTDHHDTDLVMLKCSHIMHYQCLKQLIGNKQWVRCPVCFTIFGKMIGDQPDGTMTYNVNNFMQCDGYTGCGTITINYNMYGGKRGTISYPPTHRAAYLPDNKEGNEVLQLLIEAFNRKLIFTIGRSVTTGRDNQIVWNGIHHKTHTSGGSAYFGYPDPTYFQRVKLQLAAKGVY